MQWLLSITLACALPLIFADFAAAQRNRAECRYNSSVSDISSYLRRYANCVSGSQGQDDCSRVQTH
jgi:hypothetical protein